jgi:hypothetical protein
MRTGGIRTTLVLRFCCIWDREHLFYKECEKSLMQGKNCWRCCYTKKQSEEGGCLLTAICNLIYWAAEGDKANTGLLHTGHAHKVNRK